MFLMAQTYSDKRWIELKLSLGLVLLLSVMGSSDPVITFKPTQHIDTGFSTTAVGIGDFNNDGILDLVASLLIVVEEEKDLKRINIVLSLGRGSGVFAAPQLIEFNSVRASDNVQAPRGKVLALGDVNSDGQLDVVLAYPTGGSVWVLLGDGNGSLRALSSRDLPRGLRDVSSVALADFNGDKRLDIICTNLQGSVYVLLNNGTQQVDRWSLRETFIGGSLQSIAVSDLNGNAQMDVVVSSIGRAAVLLGDDTGSFSIAQRLSAGLYSGDSPAWIEVADINGDMVGDLVTANPESDRLLFFPGDGTGRFGEPRAWPTSGLDPRAIAAADFNGDGWLDLAAVNSSSNAVTIHLNDGFGGFGPIALSDPPRGRSVRSNKAIVVPVGALPVGLAAGDLDGDGDPDLVVANQGDDAVSVLMNERR
jgi:hypothetical protein